MAIKLDLKQTSVEQDITFTKVAEVVASTGNWDLLDDFLIELEEVDNKMGEQDIQLDNLKRKLAILKDELFDLKRSLANDVDDLK